MDEIKTLCFGFTGKVPLCDEICHVVCEFGRENGKYEVGDFFDEDPNSTTVIMYGEYEIESLSDFLDGYGLIEKLKQFNSDISVVYDDGVITDIVTISCVNGDVKVDSKRENKER